MCSTISSYSARMSVSRILIFFELLKCNGGTLTNLTSTVHQNWRIVSIQKRFYAVSQRKRNAQRKFKDDVLLRREFFFQRYMFLYMTKTSVHLHYTSLSMLDYFFADSTQDS